MDRAFSHPPAPVLEDLRAGRTAGIEATVELTMPGPTGHGSLEDAVDRVEVAELLLLSPGSVRREVDLLEEGVIVARTPFAHAL